MSVIVQQKSEQPELKELVCIDPNRTEHIRFRTFISLVITLNVYRCVEWASVARCIRTVIERYMCEFFELCLGY